MRLSASLVRLGLPRSRSSSAAISPQVSRAASLRCKSASRMVRALEGVLKLNFIVFEPTRGQESAWFLRTLGLFRWPD